MDPVETLKSGIAKGRTVERKDRVHLYWESWVSREDLYLYEEVWSRGYKEYK